MTIGILKNIFSASTSKLVDAVGNTVDKISTTKEEKLKAKSEIITTLTDFTSHAFELQKELTLAEMHGNKYQRSWRPSLMYMCMFIIFNVLFLFPFVNTFVQNEYLGKFITQAMDLKPFWNVLAIGTGVIGIGRSGEKIATNFFNSVSNKK